MILSFVFLVQMKIRQQLLSLPTNPVLDKHVQDMSPTVTNECIGGGYVRSGAAALLGIFNISDRFSSGKLLPKGAVEDERFWRFTGTW